jgi:hypothetical protein
MRGDVLLLFIYICIASLCIAYLRYACDCTRVKDTPHRHRLRHGKSKPSAPLRRLDEAWDDATSWDDTTAAWDDYDVGGFDLDDLGSRLALALFVATLACFMICSCVVQCLAPAAPRARPATLYGETYDPRYGATFGASYYGGYYERPSHVLVAPWWSTRYSWGRRRYGGASSRGGARRHHVERHHHDSGHHGGGHHDSGHHDSGGHHHV